MSRRAKGPCWNMRIGMIPPQYHRSRDWRKTAILGKKPAINYFLDLKISGGVSMRGRGIG